MTQMVELAKVGFKVSTGDIYNDLKENNDVKTQMGEFSKEVKMRTKKGFYKILGMKSTWNKILL